MVDSSFVTLEIPNSLRIGQTLNNFTSWHDQKYKTDYFYISDQIFFERYEEFLTWLKDQQPVTV